MSISWISIKLQSPKSIGHPTYTVMLEVVLVVGLGVAIVVVDDESVKVEVGGV